MPSGPDPNENGTMPTGDPQFVSDLLRDLEEGIYITDRDRRVLYWNRGAEALTGFPASRVLGSRCRDNLLMHVDEEGTQLCDDRCPLEATMQDGDPREAHVFLHHADGYRVPVRVRSIPVRDASGALVGAAEVFSRDGESPAATHRIAELEALAYLDTLTGLPNRRYVQTHVEQRIGELQRYGWPFGVVLLDVDHFKNVNDRYGHPVGDRVLIMVAKTLGLATRSFDLVGRWGGEEFLGVITNVDAAGLAAAADRFRALVRASSLDEAGSTISVTISAGAALADVGDGPERLLERADRLLYLSKEGGRDRTSM